MDRKEAAKWRLKTIGPFPCGSLKRFGTIGEVWRSHYCGEMTSDALAEISQQNANIILVDNYSEAPSYDCIQTD